LATPRNGGRFPGRLCDARTNACDARVSLGFPAPNAGSDVQRTESKRDCPDSPANGADARPTTCARMRVDAMPLIPAAACGDCGCRVSRTRPGNPDGCSLAEDSVLLDPASRLDSATCGTECSGQTALVETGIPPGAMRSCGLDGSGARWPAVPEISFAAMSSAGAPCPGGGKGRDLAPVRAVLWESHAPQTYRFTKGG
jgi:hypothetical protein